MSVLDILKILLVFGVIIAFCLPAKVEVKKGLIHFSVKPYFSNKTAKLEDLEYLSLRRGMFPILMKFKGGKVFRWTSFPPSKYYDTANMICDALVEKGIDPDTVTIFVSEELHG